MDAAGDNSVKDEIFAEIVSAEASGQMDAVLNEIRRLAGEEAVRYAYAWEDTDLRGWPYELDQIKVATLTARQDVDELKSAGG